MSPIWTTFARWLLTLVLLLIIAYFRKKPKWEGYNVLLLTELEHITVTNADLVSALQPGFPPFREYLSESKFSYKKESS